MIVWYQIAEEKFVQYVETNILITLWCQDFAKIAQEIWIEIPGLQELNLDSAVWKKSIKDYKVFYDIMKDHGGPLNMAKEKKFVHHI